MPSCTAVSVSQWWLKKDAEPFEFAWAAPIEVESASVTTLEPKPEPKKKHCGDRYDHHSLTNLQVAQQDLDQEKVDDATQTQFALVRNKIEATEERMDSIDALTKRLRH